MGIVNVWEKAGRTGIDREGTREYKRTYGVQATSPNVGKAEILAAVGLPQQWYPYITDTETDLGALVHRRNPTQDSDAGVFWTVEIEYSSQHPKPEHANPNPLLRPPRIAWAAERVKKALTKGYVFDTGLGAWKEVAILTSSSETFDPTPEDDRIRLILNYERNVATMSHTNILNVIDHINETIWYGFAAEIAKVEDLKYAEADENGTSYWRESWQIKMDPEGWRFRPLDMGYYEIVGGERRLITDEAGRPLQVPALLDGAGQKLAIGGTPFFHNYRIKEFLEFNTLGIP